MPIQTIILYHQSFQLSSQNHWDFRWRTAGYDVGASGVATGHSLRVLEDSANAPARLLGKVFSSEQFEDFAQSCDIFTLEFENTAQTCPVLESTKTLYPSSFALSVAQDRLNEKLV